MYINTLLVDRFAGKWVKLYEELRTDGDDDDPIEEEVTKDYPIELEVVQAEHEEKQESVGNVSILDLPSPS